MNHNPLKMVRTLLQAETVQYKFYPPDELQTKESFDYDTIQIKE